MSRYLRILVTDEGDVQEILLVLEHLEGGRDGDMVVLPLEQTVVVLRH